MNFAPARVAACVAVLVLGLVGCGPVDPGAGAEDDGREGTGAEGRTKILMVTDSFVTPFRNYQVQMLAGLIRSRAGVDFNAMDVGGDALLQAGLLDKAVAESVDVLLVFPLLSDAVVEALQRAQQQGVKVVVFGGDLPGDAYTAEIAADEKLIGRLAGDFVVSALGQKAKDEGFMEVRGRVVQLRGGEEDMASESMAAGFSEALQKEPGIKLVHDAPGDWIEESAGLRINEAIRLQKTFDVVFAQNDLMAVGASKALTVAGMRDAVLVMGVDGAPGSQGGMERVRREELEATIYRPPLVDVAWTLLQHWLDDRAVAWPKRTVVKPFLMTAEEAAKQTGRGLPVPDLKEEKE